MPPKAKAKAKAKAKVRAKARAKALPKALPKRRAGRLRRAAAAEAAAGAGQSPLEKWKRGEEVKAGDIPMEELLRAPLLIIEDGVYFQGECKVAGHPRGSLVSEGHLYLKMTPTGTTSEAILKLQSGNADLSPRLHICDGACASMESADDLIHAKKVRSCPIDAPDQGWMTNLAKGRPSHSR